jgi:hypothetical protein
LVCERSRRTGETRREQFCCGIVVERGQQVQIGHNRAPIVDDVSGFTSPDSQHSFARRTWYPSRSLRIPAASRSDLISRRCLVRLATTIWWFDMASSCWRNAAGCRIGPHLHGDEDARQQAHVGNLISGRVSQAQTGADLDRHAGIGHVGPGKTEEDVDEDIDLARFPCQRALDQIRPRRGATSRPCRRKSAP